jgi:hypothetical protein
VKTLLQRWEAWTARREEARALRALGERLEPSPEIRALDEKVAALEWALGLSVERDRQDYAAVSRWAQPLVVVRGIVDRLVTRALIRRGLQERALACERHGSASLEAARGLDADFARGARDARLLAESQVEPLPAAVREVHHFGTFVAKEAKGQLVPRLPALAGLAVGWWIAQTFTDSQLSATLHAWGLGAGPRHAVRSETLRAMSFWLPLLAAAVCSYAGSRLSALVRARYEKPTSAAGSSSGRA